MKVKNPRFTLQDISRLPIIYLESLSCWILVFVAQDSILVFIIANLENWATKRHKYLIYLYFCSYFVGYIIRMDKLKNELINFVREFPDRSIRWLLESPDNVKALLQIIANDLAKQIDYTKLKRIDRT